MDIHCLPFSQGKAGSAWSLGPPRESRLIWAALSSATGPRVCRTSSATSPGAEQCKVFPVSRPNATLADALGMIRARPSQPPESPLLQGCQGEMWLQLSLCRRVLARPQGAPPIDQPAEEALGSAVPQETPSVMEAIGPPGKGARRYLHLFSLELSRDM